MKKNTRILIGLALTIIISITGISYGNNSKILDIKTICAQDTNNVKFLPNYYAVSNGIGKSYFLDGIINLYYSKDLSNTSTDENRVLVFVDKNGNVINTFEGVGVELNPDIYTTTNLRVVTTKDGKYEMLLDEEGNILIGFDKKFTKIDIFDKNILAFEKEIDSKTKKYGIMDIKGNIIKETKNPVFNYSNGRAIVMNGSDPEYYIDLNGKTYFENMNFQELSAYSKDENELISIKKDGEWGYINTKGDIVVKPQFRDTENTINGIGKVALNNKDGRREFLIKIDKNKKITNVTKYYDSITNFSKNGFAIAEVDSESNKYEILNKNNLENPIIIDKNITINLYSDKLENINLKYLPAYDNTTKEYIIINTNGDVVLRLPKYLCLENVLNNENLFIVSVKEKTNKYKNNGIYILDLSNSIPTLKDIENAKIMSKPNFKPNTTNMKTINIKHKIKK